MAVKNTVKTRRGLRIALGILEGKLADVRNEGLKAHGMSKSEMEDFAQAVAWINQEAAVEAATNES